METPGPSLVGRNQFLIYRLFSLAGLVPVGAYMVVHLVVNATMLISPMTYQQQVDNIHALGFLVPLLEWTFIFIPILFHGVVGLIIVSGSMPNTSAYPYVNNIRYTLQRATGMIAFAYIFYHVYQMHHLGHFLGGGRFDPDAATSSTAEVLSSLPTQLLYGVGVLSCVYHLANGLWTAGITWGIWTTPAAMRRAGWISLVFGLLMAAMVLATLLGFGRVDVEKVKKLEEHHQQVKAYQSGEKAPDAFDHQK